MPPGRWRDRFVFALKTSLDVLEPHRVALRALMPVLVGDPEEGVFAESAAFSRLRVQGAFEEAVVGATDAPAAPLAAALGRLLYLVHLAVLLWWLLDKSAGAARDRRSLALTDRCCRRRRSRFGFPPMRRFVISLDELIREALFGNPATTTGSRRMILRRCDSSTWNFHRSSGWDAICWS